MTLKFLSVFVLTYLLWIGFTISVAFSELVMGVVVALIVAIVTARYSKLNIGIDFPIRALKFVFGYLPVFIVAMVKANLDVARRVLNPSLPINPAIVKVPVKLKGEISKLTLANSITLTPGTLSLDLDKEGIYVHWIDKKSDNPEEIKKAIVGSFERRIGGIFE
ncbi:cation:proton antiporter [Kosmotoga arenicorallina S304]|uniref:Cation:proton antiporter n=1 Tax=Kosmotoga arenicorallina S304 TaxID=1453497 RepID=A0A176JXI5_9BACT|nr:Na+/H+ antiporter subunit E [Kosmotoga arenicorallina]OAA28430.1 cation:proton antiporter [Kosmotoga arenicorallina S304]